MSAKVTVVDYGSGNLLSVCRALKHCGAEITTTERADDILSAPRVVIPGVGAMADSMRNLEIRGLVDPIRAIAGTRPLLGICVGMQILFDAGEEFGIHPGLGILKGRVRVIPKTRADGSRRKIPHIGWNALTPAPGINGWDDTILAGLPEMPNAYFLHSFAAAPEDEAIRLAECNYDGVQICSVVKKDLTYGCQFHPEKSGDVGLSILRNFLSLDD